MSKLESIRYKRGHLEILDQLKIPREHLYIDIKNTEQGKKSKVFRLFNWGKNFRLSSAIGSTMYYSLSRMASDPRYEHKGRSSDCNYWMSCFGC